MKSDNENTPGNSSLPTNPEGFSSLYNYISLLARHREYEKCGELLTLLIGFIRELDSDGRKKIPQLSTGYCLIAENHLRTGEVSAAAGLYQEGLHVFPQSDELRLGYGECLIQLQQFESSDQLLKQLDENKRPSPDQEFPQGLYTYRKNSALGNLYQSWGRTEEAHHYFTLALEYNKEWIPAHIGLIETEIINGNAQSAEQYLSAVINKVGQDPALILASANIALISSQFAEAEEYAIRLKGELLGDDRFEYLLFLIDFFQGDHESLTQVPNLISGETVETEAARIWLNNLQGWNHQPDPLRIPEEIWRSEYVALDHAWEEVTSKHKSIS